MGPGGERLHLFLTTVDTARNGLSPRVSAAMIVRNEERFLPGCLESVRAEVDEIVIVDTGSSDRTPDIARDAGAVLLTYPWHGDFAAARNVALDAASGDWILYIDADERLLVAKPGDLRRVVDRPGAVAGHVRFRPRVGFTPYREIRLFRRDPRIRFRGRIHETVHPDIGAVERSDGLSLVDMDVGIDHLGYEGDLSHKFARNLPLLEAAVRQDPKRVFLWTDLARALAGMGRSEDAVAACRQAIAVATEAGDSNGKQRRDGALAWLELIGLAAASGPEAAARSARTALAAYPEDHAIRLATARTALAVGDADAVPPLTDPLLAIDADAFMDPLMAYDKRIFGEWVWDLRGAALLRLGRRAEAAAAFRRAGELASDGLPYRVKAIAAAGPGV